MKLTDRFDDVITVDGVGFHLDLSFDNILRVYELRDDDELDDFTKIDYMFQMLVVDGEVMELDIEQKSVIIERIFEVFIFKDDDENIKDEEQEETLRNDGNVTPKKTWDIEKDAELIYASFLFDYNIDLFEQHGKLHWKKFLALLNGLSEDSPFMQVVRIRTMDVPKPNKHNAKERANIQRLKRLYALEQEPSGIDGAFDAIAKRLGKAGEDSGRRTNTDRHED